MTEWNQKKVKKSKYAAWRRIIPFSAAGIEKSLIIFPDESF